jgi:hypothetical protein
MKRLGTAQVGWLLALMLLLPAGGAARAQFQVGRETTVPYRAETVAALVRALDDPDRLVRMTAFRAIEATRPPEAVPALIPLLKDRDPERASLTTRLLLKYGTPAAVAAVVGLADERKGEYRIRVAQLLMQSPRVPAMTEAMGFFTRLSREADPQLRAISLAGMARLSFGPSDAILPYFDNPGGRPGNF